MNQSNARRFAAVLPWLVSLGLVATLAAATLQDRWKEKARGTYRAILSRPIPGIGWKAGALSADVDVASAFVNQLDRDDLVPVHMELFQEYDGEGKPLMPRIFVIARPR